MYRGRLTNRNGREASFYRRHRGDEDYDAERYIYQVLEGMKTCQEGSYTSK
jgi:hypothetical protein